jgi:NAD(P)H-dependent FMN reductase
MTSIKVACGHRLVSRPPNQPFNEKPIAITGASPSMLGSARAQYDLLIHQGSQKLVVEHLQALVAFVDRVRPRGAASAAAPR